MYTFIIERPDGKTDEYNHILKVTYKDSFGKEINLEGDDILSHSYPLYHDLSLFSENATYIISKKQISIINVLKED